MPETEYVWDELSDNVIEEYEGGVLTASYSHEPGLYGNLLRQNRSGTTHYYHYDGRGDTVALTDDSGSITDAKSYDAWGNIITSTGNTATPFQFVGRQGYQADPATDSVYVRARHLQSSKGRWSSPDPLNYIDGLNLYMYGTNRAIIAVDPAGLSFQIQPSFFNPLRPIDIRVPCPPGVGVFIGTPQCADLGGLLSFSCHYVFWLGWCFQWVKAYCGRSGDCDSILYRHLVAKKAEWCNSSRSCAKVKCVGQNDPTACAEITKRLAINDHCISYRRRVMNECFKKGDNIHRNELREVIKVRDACTAKYESCGCK